MIVALSSIFLVTQKITGQYSTSLLSILFLTTSSYFTNYTFWTISPRGPFMAFLPLFLLSIIRLSDRVRRVNLMEIIITIFLLLLLMTTHRMYTFVAVTIIFPFLIFLTLTRYIESKQLASVYSRKIYQYLVLCISMLLIIIAIFAPNLYSLLGVPVSHFWIREKFDIQYVGPLLNVLFTYFSTNPLLFFTAIGVFNLIYYPFIRYHHRYLLLVVLFSMPFIVNYEYFYPVLLTMLSILGAIGLKNFLHFIEIYSSREKSFTLLIVIILILIPYTVYIKELQTNIGAEREQSDTVKGYGIIQETYNQGIWNKEYLSIEDKVLSNGPIFKITWIDLVPRMDDYDSISYDKNFGRLIEVEPYTPIDVLLHTGKGKAGSGTYHYGGYVYDWSGVYQGSMPTNFHRSVMLLEPDSFYFDIYRPTYALSYDFEVMGSDKEEGIFFSEVSENSYTIVSNEVWTLYYIKD